MQIAAKSTTALSRRLTALVVAAVVSLVAAIAWSAEPAAQPAAQPDVQPPVYVVRPGDTLLKICARFRAVTGHYTLNDLLADLRRVNDLQSNTIGIGQRLTIPLAERRPGLQVGRRVQDGAPVVGIYLSGPACGVSSVLQRVDDFIAAGGNAVVFDAKDIDGGVSFPSALPLATSGGGRSAPLIPSLPDLLGRLHERGLYVVARLAVFLDGRLGTGHPEFALHDPQGQPWRERGCVWLDPAHPQVRAYTLGLAAELAAAGVDEVQFDYVRYPTNGWRGDWAGSLEATALARRRVIEGFLQDARDALAATKVKISADLYGVMAWDDVRDLALTGQSVPAIARLVDTLCPMIYPSHFGPGFAGHQRPGDVPEAMVGGALRGFADLTGGQVPLRPWLQAFPYGVTAYDSRYILRQLEAAGSGGAQGWCFWNPACQYAVVNAALLSAAAPAPAGEVAMAVPSPARQGAAGGPAPTP